jgi:hypothetical protein
MMIFKNKPKNQLVKYFKQLNHKEKIYNGMIKLNNGKEDIFKEWIENMVF